MSLSVERLEECLANADATIERLSALVRAQQITIDKMEQALAAPVQEPMIRSIKSMLQPDAFLPNGMLNPKYTTPPAQSMLQPDAFLQNGMLNPKYTTPPAQPAPVQPADDLSDVLKRADVLYQKIGQQWFDLIPRIYSQARADKLKENT